MGIILHITREEAWQNALAAREYRTASLESEGFIHCSTVEQLLLPANQLYRGQTGLVLLQIDPDRLQAPLVYEDCYDTGHRFPHIYGPLNLDAVQGTLPFPPNSDGTFSLPPELGALSDI